MRLTPLRVQKKRYFGIAAPLLRRFGSLREPLKGGVREKQALAPAGSGYGRLPFGEPSVPGAVADQSVITGGYRVFFGDNELVHCQKIDILIGVFTN